MWIFRRKLSSTGRGSLARSASRRCASSGFSKRSAARRLGYGKAAESWRESPWRDSCSDGAAPHHPVRLRRRGAGSRARDRRLIGLGFALEGRHLNSLGFQPQVGSPTPLPIRPEGRDPNVLNRRLVSERHRPLGAGKEWGTAYLGLKPQAIQMPPPGRSRRRTRSGRTGSEARPNHLAERRTGRRRIGVYSDKKRGSRHSSRAFE